MESIVIREVKENQKKLYSTFFNNGLVTDESNFRMSVNDVINLPFPTEGTKDSFTLGAFSEGELAGVVSFERDGKTREKLRHKGTLFRMYVGKDYRGKGISRLLIQEVIEKVRALRDIEKINLTVISDNTIAKRLYEKFGFITFSQEENAIKWKGNYFQEDQMSLNLL